MKTRTRMTYVAQLTGRAHIYHQNRHSSVAPGAPALRLRASHITYCGPLHRSQIHTTLAYASVQELIPLTAGACRSPTTLRERGRTLGAPLSIPTGTGRHSIADTHTTACTYSSPANARVQPYARTPPHTTAASLAAHLCGELLPAHGPLDGRLLHRRW